MLKKYLKCWGCSGEIHECFEYQEAGYDAGLEFYDDHCFFFVLDKRGKFIIK